MRGEVGTPALPTHLQQRKTRSGVAHFVTVAKFVVTKVPSACAVLVKGDSVSASGLTLYRTGAP